MAYALVPSKLFLTKLKKLDNSIVIELDEKLKDIKANPIVPERRMHHAYNFFRAYVRNFRLIYKVEGESIILFDIIKRDEDYRQFGN